MNLFESWKGFIEKAQSMNEKDLAAWRYLIMFVIVADLFGVYWYFELKKLGMAILIVSIIFLVIILLLERGLPEKEKEESKEIKKGMSSMGTDINQYIKNPKEQKPEQENQQSNFMDFGNLGLPNSEEYNKRLKNAMGDFGEI